MAVGGEPPLSDTCPGHDAVETSPSNRTSPLRPPSSINKILRDHARRRLYVQPLHWTEIHLHLLNCVFAARHCARRDGKDGLRARNYGHTTVATDDASGGVSIEPTHWRINGPEDADTVVWNGLHSHGFQQAHNPYLYFMFSKRPVCPLPVKELYAVSSTGPAMLAFLDLDRLAARRDRSFALSPCKRVSPPVARLRMKKQASVQPLNIWHDPYIAAVLIALAQEQHHSSPAKTGATDDACPTKATVGDQGAPQALDSCGPKVYLFAASGTNLYLYTARVPLSFLDRLDRPSQCSVAEEVRLCYRRVSLKRPQSFGRVAHMIAKSAGTGGN